MSLRARADRAWLLFSVPTVPGGILDTLRVLRLRGDASRSGEDGEPVPVRMKALKGDAVWVRPGTTDLGAAAAYYIRDVQLPPPEIAAQPLRRIVELGSNVGAGLTALGIAYPEAQLLGAEPDPHNARIARRNLERFGSRAAIAEVAIWETEAELVVDRDPLRSEQAPGSHGHAVRPRAAGDDPAWPSIPALSIDGLLAKHMPVGEIDYMHVSIEGSEPRSFAAPGEWRQRVRSLRVEAHPYFGYGIDACVSQLEGLGYRAWEAPRPSPPGKFVFAVRKTD